MDIALQDEIGSGLPREAAQRSEWARSRLELETRRGRRRSWFQQQRLTRHLFEFADRALRPRFMRPLTRAAYRPRLSEPELLFPNLPQAFDGYRILHLSDLHFDRQPGIEHVVAAMTQNVQTDLAVFTGDYQDRRRSSYGGRLETAVLRPMRILCQAIHARDGILATLGNHDSVHMVEPFESQGMRVLCNETVRIRRGDQSVHVTGLDDVHRYYTPMARDALRAGHHGFKIALVHSADLYEEASNNGYALQLSGHTHGGQVCLPGGVPVFTNLRAGRRFAAGMWQHGQLRGITSRGVGTVGAPLRVFCPGEVLLITLRRRSSATGPRLS